MQGTIFSDMNLGSDIPSNSLFNIEDYRLCMELCYHSYGKNIDRYYKELNGIKYNCKIPKQLNDYIQTKKIRRKHFDV